MKTLQIPCTGYSIAADWYDGSDSNKILLNIHGYTSSKAHQADTVAALVEQTGTSALAIDLSGHGDSPFELRDTRPAQHFLEVVCAFDWLISQYPDAEISVTGESYGGFLAVQLTKYRQFRNLVLRAPAIYKPDQFYTPWSVRLDNVEAYNESIESYRRDSEALARHPLLGRASRFQGRTLVVVHELDGTVPRQTTDAYINAFHADSFIAEGFAHSIRRSSLTEQQLQDYRGRIAEWLKLS